MNEKKAKKMNADFMDKLMLSTWDEIEKADLIDALSGFPDMYGEKYKKKFGFYPGQKKAAKISKIT